MEDAMVREWQPNTSNYDFWRSDNPLIQGWWRFGGVNPKNNFQTPEEKSTTNYLSGMMVDSGPAKNHLKPFYDTTDVETIFPVAGIAPWDATGSGLEFRWVNNTLTDRRAALYADPTLGTEAGTQGTQGALCVGNNMYSGLTVIGWMKIPNKVPNDTTVMKIAGRHNAVGGAQSNVGIVWAQTTLNGPYTLQLVHRSEDTFVFPAATEIVSVNLASNTHPFFPSNRLLPFFVAWQIRREDVEENRSFTGNGSGQITMWAGTAASGITCSNSAFFRGISCQSHQPYQNASLAQAWTFGGDSRVINSAVSSANHLPSGSILDEFVYVADGFLTSDRILHYALSGLRLIETSNPESSGFVPQYPADDGLIAYWNFDEDDGHNSSPNTENDPRLELSLSGIGTSSITFGNGIREGRCIRVTADQTTVNTSAGQTLLATRDYPCIPAQSGLSLLFPSGQSMDEGMTIIGWMRSVPTGSVNLGGGGFGWLGRDGRHSLFCIESLTGTNATNRNSLSCLAHVSGAGLSPLPNVRMTTATTTSTNPFSIPGHAIGLTNATATAIPEYDSGDDGWHLWAGVFDLKAGQMYMVRDAKHLKQMVQTISSASGWSSTGLGVNDGFFGFFNTVSTRTVEFDDFAVYSRILSIPEMSGYALLGIQRPAPDPFLATPLKSLAGYWPMDEIENYDPTGTSGYRLNDHSWYRHHLTNLSGTFSLGSRLNAEFTDASNSLQINTSGSIVSLERVFHGANLDGSSTELFSLSGMSVGTWLYLPSGDLGTLGNGSSGLYGDHMVMGAWSQAATERSWFLGIRDNKPHIKFVNDSLVELEFTASATVPFNTPFFLGANFLPSGALQIHAQVVMAEVAEIEAVRYVIDTSFGLSSDIPNVCSASGISFLNAPNLNYGFPQTTRIGLAFVHHGHLNAAQWIATKRSIVDDVTLASGAISTSDPANISVWHLDSQVQPAHDFGREQNHLTLINLDGHGVGIFPAIHISGTIIRTQEYLNAESNSNARRLDLGSGTQSWTLLGWVRPNAAPSTTDRHVIMNKGGGNDDTGSGIQVYTPSDAFTLVSHANDANVVGQNGDLIPGAWNHIAVVFDRDNDKFTNVINGRYAGLTQKALVETVPNNSGFALGGRGDQQNQAIPGGSAFSGILDDFMIFARALTLPEISGLAANSYNYAESPNDPVTGHFGGYISGIEQQLVSGLIGAFIHGYAQDLALFGGYISGVSGQIDHIGGFIHGMGQISGLFGGYLHGMGQISGLFGGFLVGMDIASGVIGAYVIGAGEALSEFDITFNFQIVAAKDFDSRLEVVKTAYHNFDAQLGVIRITRPPECELQMPAIGLVASGTPYTLTVRGSGWAYEDKSLSKVRFTFSDFKGAASGIHIGGLPNSGLYEATRTYDTPGWYTIKMELMDSYGYRHSCIRPFLLMPSGSTSGAYLATLPGIEFSATPVLGSTIQRVLFTYGLSGLATTSGFLEYTDFADQQESLLNGLESPSGTQFVSFVREHDFTMPGQYRPVWAVSGSWGVVSDSISPGIDYL
jgi:hypothetical protein